MFFEINGKFQRVCLVSVYHICLYYNTEITKSQSYQTRIWYSVCYKRKSTGGFVKPALFFDSHYTSLGNDKYIITHKAEFVKSERVPCRKKSEKTLQGTFSVLNLITFFIAIYIRL